MNKRVVFVVGSVLALVAHGELAEHQWDVFGSFGRACGQIERKDGEMLFDGKEYRIRTTVETDANGVSVRKSVIRNVSDRTIHAYCLLDRFLMEGGEYEVYTQASSWENESRGSWQDLHTGISVRGSLICGSNGFAPMLAVWNVQAGRGCVYHLLSDGAWQIGAARVPGNGGQTATTVAIEMGVDSRHLNYALEPGESLALPTVVSYEFRNKTDLDCHKLHAFWNARHPAKRNPPTIYNSWLSRFDKMELPHLLRQVEKARRLGVEYFVLDAGWFGPKADWTSVRGDWEERADGALGGRMGEVAEAVRKAGMKFGFWIEAESASPTSKIVKEHPEYFTVLNGVYFLDFTRKDAFDYIVGTTCALLKKYGAEFMKFDFNQNADYDPTGKAFIAYNAAFRRYIREVRRRNPNVYIEGCASGGLMMNLGWAEDYDSLWPSDNQSPYHGMRIVKETILRVPPRMLERWVVARTVENIQPNYAGVDSRLMACDDGCWFRMRSVEPSYLDAFTLGGPVGFSCDLTAFSEPDLKRLSDVLSERRKDASFWNRSVGRILCDTPSLVAFQYDDGTLDDVRVVVVSDNLRQSRTTIHPVLAAGVDYRVDGRIRTAGDLAANGLGVALSSFRGTVFRLTAVRGPGRDRAVSCRIRDNVFCGSKNKVLDVGAGFVVEQEGCE